MIPDSKPRQAFDIAQDRGVILVSIATLTELNEVLGRSKFDKYLSEEQRKRFLAALVNNSALIEITEEITDCRDTKDNKFLEVAVCGKANCIISGDKDLLELNPFRGIAVLRATEFLEKY